MLCRIAYPREGGRRGEREKRREGEEERGRAERERKRREGEREREREGEKKRRMRRRKGERGQEREHDARTRAQSHVHKVTCIKSRAKSHLILKSHLLHSSPLHLIFFFIIIHVVITAS
eukprot:646882-Rhodomonas_salina.1